MDQINYNHLYYFWVIASEGGVTAACKKLRLTQPTLSAQLKQFEENIGKILFERRNRKLILNDAGRLVFDFADSIFKKGSDLVKAIRDSSVKDFVTITVGAVDTLPRKNLHGFLKIPVTHGPYNLNLVISKFNDLVEQLKNRQLDYVLADRALPPDIKGCTAYVIEKTPVVFVGAPAFKQLRKKFPASLAGQNLYLPSYQTQTRSLIDNFLKANGVTARIKGEIQDSEFLRVIAAAGDGIVAIVRSAVSDLLKTKELLVLSDNLDIHETFYMITREKIDDQPAVMEIVGKIS